MRCVYFSSLGYRDISSVTARAMMSLSPISSFFFFFFFFFFALYFVSSQTWFCEKLRFSSGTLTTFSRDQPLLFGIHRSKASVRFLGFLHGSHLSLLPSQSPSKNAEDQLS